MEKYDRAMDDLFSTPALEASLHQEYRKKINNLIDEMLRSMLLARSGAAMQIKENVEEINEDYNDVAELNNHASKNEEQQEENSNVFASSIPENIDILSSFQQNNQDKAFKQVTGKSAARSAYVNESTTKSQDYEAKSDATKDHKPENIGKKNASEHNYSSNSKKSDGARSLYQRLCKL
ncbi:MAG: hypothetical protein ACRY3E_04700 [Candidatus Lariskella arthropodorum]